MFKEKIAFKTARRQFVTLIEMMIVMFLIALITGVVAYNYRGTLDEGKAFKTKAGIEKIENILSLAMADDSTITVDTWKDVIRRSPLVQNPEALIKDGWGAEYTVSINPDNGRVEVTSQKLEAYTNSKSKK